MSISNTELRRKVFGGDTSGHAPRPVRLPAITNPFAGIADLWLNLWRRMAEALSQAFPQEIGGETRKTPLAERLAASAKAKVRFEPTGRLAFADTARGIAVLQLMGFSVDMWKAAYHRLQLRHQPFSGVFPFGFWSVFRAYVEVHIVW